MEEKKKLTLAAARESLEIFEFVRPYKWQFVLGLVLLFLSSVVFMAVVQLPGIMVDIAQGRPKWGLTLRTAAIALGCILVVQGFFSYWRVMMFARVAESGVADVRRALYSRLVALPMVFFEKSRVGELVSRLTADVEKLYNTFYFVLAEFVRQIIVLLVGIAVMAWQHPRLSMVMLGVFPIVVIGAMFFGRQVRKLSKKRQEQLADSNVILDETLQSIAAVKAFSNEMFEVGRFTRSSDSVVKISMRYASGRALFTVFIITVLFGALFFIIWMGARMLQAGEITSGDLLSFGINTAIIGGAIAGLGNFYTELVGAVGATERIREILKSPTETEVFDRKNLKAGRFRGDIKFENIKFSYPTRADVPVLKAYLLKFPQGKRSRSSGEPRRGRAPSCSCSSSSTTRTRGR